MTRKRIGALVFLGLSVFYGWQIPDIPTLPVDALEAMNARSMPWALTLLGIAFSVALFVSGGTTSAKDAASLPQRARLPDVLSALVLLAWTALYAGLLGALGFFAATAVFLFGGFLLLGERRLLFCSGIALGTSGALYLLLHFALGLYLPGGTLWVTAVTGV